MNTSPVNTQTRMGLDYKVWLLMLILSLLSIGILGYKKITDKPCSPFVIYIRNLSNTTRGDYFAGDVIRLSASNTNINEIRWNFGDNSKEEIGTLVSHSYNKEGKYTITGKANNNCFQTTQIYIRKTPPILDNKFDSSINATNVISGTDIVKVGQTVIYECPFMANDYDWVILNRPDYKNRKGKFATYTFRNPQTYVLQLTIDNNREKRFTKEITVVEALNNPRPSNPHSPPPFTPPPYVPPRPGPATPPSRDSNTVPTPPGVISSEPEKPRSIEVANKQFLKLLQGVLAGSKDVQDFNDYLCNKGKTNVVVKDRSIRTLEDLCNMIRNNNKIKIEDVKANRDDNCVTRLEVTGKRKGKGLLGIGSKWEDL